jgi:hypothetical protein
MAWPAINDANNLEQTYINGFLDVSGDIIHRSNDVTIMDGNLLVDSGDISFNSGNLYVAGNVSINSNMMVTGETALTNLVTLGALDVSGATTLDSTLTVAGATILNNVTRIVDNSIFAVGTGTTTMGGNVSMNSQLSVTGDVSMNSTLQVVGATSLKNTTVAGMLTLNSTPAFLNDISFNGSRIDICGNLYANYPDNSIPADAIIRVGADIIDTDASMNAGLNVSGVTTLSSLAVGNNTSVGGTLIAIGATTLSSLNASSNATVGGMLTIASTASFLNDVSFIGSRIDICGNLYARYPNSSIPLSAVSGGNMTVYNTDVSLNARLNVVGETTLANTLAVTGKTTLSNDISFNGPRIDICGNLFAKYASNSIPQSAIIGGIGNLFTTDVSVNAGLYVQGKVTLGSATMQYKESPNIGVYIDPLISGNIVTLGNSTVGNALVVTTGVTLHEIIATGNAAIGGTLIVTGATALTNITTSSNAIIGGALSISGIPIFSTDISMNSRLVVAGDVSSNTKMMVMTDVSANARLRVGGDVSMNSTMRVAGATTLNAVTISGALTATGATTMNSTLAVTGATTIGGGLIVAGAMPFTADVSMNSGLSVGGDVSMNSKLFVAGATTMSTLNASSNGTMGGTLAVTGNSTFAAHVQMNSKLTVIGDVSLNSRLAVVNNNATTIGGTLGVLGATTMSTLTTTSNASINSTLAVTGISTFSGDVSLNGTAVRIAGSLTANGYTFNTASFLYKSIIWGQLGTDIDGEATGDQSGYSVALSKDGNVIAIGANENDGTTTNVNGGHGHVRVYQRDASQPTGWKKLGNDIDGEQSTNGFGQSVSLSSDGSIMAIGAGYNDGTTNNASDNRGSVRVYRINLSNTSGGWIQLGNDIDGEFAGDQSGFSVSLSNNGNILAIGANTNDGTGTVGSDNGHVRVYQINLTDTSGGWTQLGSDINGGALSENFGYSVSLSGDGSTIAIGAPFNDGTSPPGNTNQGCVRVYKINLSDPFLGWIQQGATIFGELLGQDQSRAGSSVALSNDGLIVAVGQPINDGTTGIGNDNCGSVRVYKRNESNITVNPNGWTQLGNDIDGEATKNQSGWSLSLSSDGSIIAIGANQNDGTGTSGNYRGHVRVYKIDLNNTELGWRQLGQDIDGEFVADQSGFSVSLSSDGSIVAIGAVYNDGTTGIYGDNRGSVRIYNRDTTIPISGAYISAPLITSNMVTNGYATVGGSLGITGNANIDKTLSVTGATTMTSLTAGNTAIVGGTLTVNDATTLSSTLNITSATTTSRLTTSSNATVGGTLNVTEATTLTALNYTDKIMQW